MTYTIRTGRFETGTEEQQQGYVMLFGGEEIRYFFDLYFHWYNIVHELGHCIVEVYGAKMSGVDEEMYVNSLAVAYYRYVGENQRLAELEDRLTQIIGRIPAPMPEGESFTAFYERIWNTEAINNVMTYGYFQLRSVLEALRGNKDLKEVLSKIGVELQNAAAEPCDATISAKNAAVFLQKTIADLEAMGVTVPTAHVELMDDPMIQCVRQE